LVGGGRNRIGPPKKRGGAFEVFFSDQKRLGGGPGRGGETEKFRGGLRAVIQISNGARRGFSGGGPGRGDFFFLPFFCLGFL